MKITASNLIRWAGLAAMVAGIIFVVVGCSIHLTFFRQSPPPLGNHPPP